MWNNPPPYMEVDVMNFVNPFYAAHLYDELSYDGDGDH